jgi:poly-gamma-glutamate synthesis protein (capsule biosynthesis protein)
MRVVLLGQAIIHEPVEWTEALRDLVDGADAVICNFEGCLPPDGAWPMKSKTVHAMHAEALELLGSLGVTHLALANNHAWDFGHGGILSTRARAKEAGFAVAGTGYNAAEAWSPAVRNGVALISIDAGPTPPWAVAGDTPGLAALGLRQQIGLPGADIARLAALSEATGDGQRRRLRRAVGFDAPSDAPSPFGLDLEETAQPCELFRAPAEAMDRLGQSVDAARSVSDLVIVALHYHHWAPEWLVPPAWFGTVADALIANGANAVVGTGPPWAFDTTAQGRHFVAPCLGNLVFHTRRKKAYDDLGLPVWRGLAGVYDAGTWGASPVDVHAPSADITP